jgi:hypothetical protein
MEKLHNNWDFMEGRSIHNHQAFFLAISVFGYIRLVYVLQPLKEHFLVIIGRRIEVHFNPRVIIKLLFRQNGFLAMKDDNGLKKGITISYNIKDDGGLPLVLAIAVRSAGHNGHPLPVIDVTAKEFERQGDLVQVDD